LPLHAYLLGDEIATMAQSSTRGIWVVPAVWLGVQAGVTVFWMLAHPAVDAIMTADASISRHEQNRFVLLIMLILPLFESFQIRSTPRRTPPNRRVESPAKLTQKCYGGVICTSSPVEMNSCLETPKA
jgi:hypothetical protein